MTRRSVEAMNQLQNVPVTPGARPGPALRRFVLHAIEMVVAMMVGMMLFTPVWDLLWPGLTDRADADALVMAVDMAAGMAAWMWLRGHGGRLVAQMSTAMVAPFVVLLVPYWLGLISGGALLVFGHAGMTVAMIGTMLVRFDAYTHAHRWRLPIRRGRRPVAAPAPVVVEAPSDLLAGRS